MISIKSIRVAGALGLTMMLSSCFYDPYYHGSHPFYAGGAYYPYDYYYYPNVGVYFHYSTGFYFYINDGIWIRSRILPPRFKLNVHSRVIVRTKSDRPYLQNKTHIDKYRPRPGIKSTPSSDRYERESLRKTYKEQQYRNPQPYNKQPPAEEKKEKRDKDKKRR